LLPTQATVVVQLPETATLSVDGQMVTLDSSKRVLVTPELRPGQDYFYSLRAEAQVNGTTLVQAKRVTVRAGGETRVDFGDLKAAAVERQGPAPSHITVRLPAEAKLLVNGVVCPIQAETRSFDTPKLQPGQTYSYTLVAELTQDGQIKSATRKLSLEAGKSVSINFDGLSAIRTASR
jgi:uncharacterized protein (TIGR03000 family)